MVVIGKSESLRILKKVLVLDENTLVYGVRSVKEIGRRGQLSSYSDPNAFCFLRVCCKE